MWISKKKYERELWETKIKSIDNHREAEQSEKIWELEQDVKKLKKKLRKLELLINKVH
jgi:hypothetical protein